MEDLERRLSSSSETSSLVFTSNPEDRNAEATGKKASPTVGRSHSPPGASTGYRGGGGGGVSRSHSVASRGSCGGGGGGGGGGGSSD